MMFYQRGPEYKIRVEVPTGKIVTGRYVLIITWYLPQNGRSPDQAPFGEHVIDSDLEKNRNYYEYLRKYELTRYYNMMIDYSKCE